jgi:hypothetical protein
MDPWKVMLGFAIYVLLLLIVGVLMGKTMGHKDTPSSPEYRAWNNPKDATRQQEEYR